jgi:hypothetical protein
MYLTLSQEKGRRLFRNADHLSSWQTRNQDAEEWGGAIRAGQNGCLLLSLSGFPDDGDEVICLYAALTLGWLDRSGAERIISYSKNRFLHRLMEWKP